MVLLASLVPAQAARPLIDSGKWDQYFALFARDTNVPWKRIGVRLDTYSGAPVDFAAFEVDPTDVLVAGANARPRAIDTSKRTAVARWKFTPPGGLQFQSNDVEVPLQNREGFFVVEARRGDAVQQVWLNLTRIGLLTKESPGGIVLYGADLGSGRALGGMRLTYLVRTSFVYGATDRGGVARVAANPRPRFVIAEWGKSRAFVSFLPQSPPPAALVGVRLDRADVHAGEHLRVVGFARRRAGNVYRPATGEMTIVAMVNGRRIASSTAKLDSAGAFTGDLLIPPNTAAGDAAIVATMTGASGGAAVHIDGVGDLSLSVAANCTSLCAPDAALALTVTAKRNGLPAADAGLRLRVLRSPHVLAPGTPDDAPQWGVEPAIDVALRTDTQGVAHAEIPAPTDGLASTYGVVATSGAASASLRLVAPTAPVALAVHAEHATIDIGETAVVTVRGFQAADGTPAAGLAVHLKSAHGPAIVEQDVVLGADGLARASFHNLAAGTNFVTAEADSGGKHAIDASSFAVEPSALANTGSSTNSDVRVMLDRQRYHVNDRVSISATLPNAVGDAFVTIDGVRGLASQTVSAAGGRAQASLSLPESVGDAAAGIAFVRDGALAYATAPIIVDGPGHQRLMTLTTDKPTYPAGGTAHVTIEDGADRAPATLAIRVSDARGVRGAVFDDAPGLLATSGTTTQNLASDNPAWHAYVTPARSTVGDIFGSDRPRGGANTDLSLAVASGHMMSWRIDRADRAAFDLVLPQEPGHYVVSVLKMMEDGDVGAATLAITVQ